MRKHFIRNKKVRYGTVAALLTVMVIVVTVLFNAVFSTLAERYLWYGNMNEVEAYEVTEDCYALLGRALANAKQASGKDAQVKIIFCDLEENLLLDDVTRFLYHTATSIAERFAEIDVVCYDILTDPTTVKDYTVSLDIISGEEVERGLASTSVIVVGEDYHRVYELVDFYVFADLNDPDSIWGYKGEMKLASAILRAVDPETHIACVTNNHGEVFTDYELLYLLDDAGYTVVYMDLSKDPIPADCELIVSYNPNTDLVADELSSVSEVELLDAFLATEGHSFLVFMESGTPNLPVFEEYLKKWGVSSAYSAPSASGTAHRYMVRDKEHSLTSDGYTIFADPVQTEAVGELLEGLDKQVVFKSATALKIAAEGYIDHRDGSYVSADGKRTVYPLYRSDAASQAWANGALVDGGASILMTLTEQKNAGGSSFVGVVSSVDFSSGDFLQSAVYGNGDTMMRIFTELGRDITPEGLTLKPFASTDISMITTAQMLRWTLVLSLIPAVVVTTVAIAVLVKRRRA